MEVAFIFPIWNMLTVFSTSDYIENFTETDNWNIEGKYNERSDERKKKEDELDIRSTKHVKSK